MCNIGGLYNGHAAEDSIRLLHAHGCAVEIIPAPPTIAGPENLSVWFRDKGRRRIYPAKQRVADQTNPRKSTVSSPKNNRRYPMIA